MSPEEAAAPPPAEEWVEVYRGPRRRAQVIIRVMTDALIPARDARRQGVVAITPRDGVVQVPAARIKDATLVMETLKKNFPALFVVGAAKGD